ncbi:MAG: FKBP-type peptidyl-prolyl cis-trans isomerase [Bacteroidia bacterium]|nr:FKBP-type peptidyl-prolyl cis-trans isomerase [Bacteroidia bacterium]
MLLSAFGYSCTQQNSNAGSESQKLQNKIDSVSYIVGNNLAYQSVGVKLNAEMISRGFEDASTQAELLISEADAQRLMLDFQQELANQQAQRIQQEAATNEILGMKYLEENRSKPGFTELPSGLQYKVLKSGKGESPDPDDRVKTRFTGKTIDGNVFDTTEKNGTSEPRTFEVNKVILGWQEALLMMKPGDHWELVIPSQLGYGKELRDPIPPNSVLIFDLELVEVIKN